MKSLKVKLALIISILSFALLGIEGLVANRFMKGSFEDELDSEYTKQASFFESVIDAWVNTDVGMLDATASAVVAAQVNNDNDNIVSVLEQLTADQEGIAMVYCVYSDGKLINGSGWDPGDSWDGRTRSWYTNAVAANGEVAYSSPYVDDNTGKLVITFSKYFNENGCEGVAAIDVYEEALLGSVESFVGAFGKEGEYLIVTGSDGTIIHHPNADFMPTTDHLTNISELLDGAYLSSIETDDAFTDYTGTDCYVTATTSYTTGWQIIYVSPCSYYDNSLNLIKYKIRLVFVICLAIGIACSIATGIFTAKPIADASNKVNEFVDKVKAGKADLKSKITVSSKDEVGVLVDGVNNMIEALGFVIGEINNATESLAEDVNTLQDAAKTTSSNVNNISSTMEEMSATSEETSASTTQVAKEVIDISNLAKTMLSNSKAKASELDKSLKDVAALKAKIETDDANMVEKLNVAINSLQEKIAATKKVEDIQQMTEGISDVASETNLLSLNASIEAARAGEMGKGFAVVAGEIGSLANNSSQMAESIQAVSDEVLDIVDELVKAAKEVSEIMLSITEENSREKVDIIENYIAALDSCYKVMSEVSDNNSEIENAMSSIKSSIEAIDTAAEENTAGITNVATSTTDLVNISDDVLNRAESVEKTTKALQSKIEGYEC